tara:strand:+ start:3092 stop:3502 length:411 start_codon:yes stop_codon:yes gene_type:complete
MNELQKLLKKTTINFPGAFNFEDARKILRYVEKELGENVRVDGNFSGHLGINQGESCYVSEVRGLMVYPEGKQIGLSGFSLIRSGENSRGYFSGLKFEPPVGCDLDEINPVELNLYDRVRSIIEEGFAESENLIFF